VSDRNLLSSNTPSAAAGCQAQYGRRLREPPPNRQLAACELELDRIRSALHRGEELDDDVAIALELVG